MILIKEPNAMHDYVNASKRTGKRIGFVPTMGFLHAGHTSLASLCRTRESCDEVIMSIFVNPLQFGPQEDYEKYPRDMDRDTSIAEKAGVDVLFVPDASAMYPAAARTKVEVEEMSQALCGVSRPTHFRGVTTVVAKLLNIVNPDVAAFGQKDAQQFFILQRMVADLNMPVQLVMAPIVREADGLAMSSRNVYLNEEERKQALSLSRALVMAHQMIEKGETKPAVIIQRMTAIIRQQPLAKIDYVAIVETENLQPIQTIQSPALIALAVLFGKTRLIDNIII